jgi:type I restriction-modification system DNA methylase subunit
MDQFDIPLNPEGKIIDFLSGVLLDGTPEEFVRQQYLRVLHFEYQYPKNHLAREVPIYYGSKELKDSEGRPVRADIVIYATAAACKVRDQGRIEIIVECKAPNESSGYGQLVSYIFNTSANGGVWYNGDVKYYRRLSTARNELIPWTGIPRKGEAWDALGCRRKEDLKRPKDIKGLLRRCHNKLHGRGVDGEEEDLTMDMVRMILAKAKDEESPDEFTTFYCTPEEYATPEGQAQVEQRVQDLFAKVVIDNPDVFGEYERVTVGRRAIADVVVELQNYRLLSDLLESDDWDIMGYAYEQYTATYLKRQRGQFFTNRLVIDFMVGLLDPTYEDVILDPAGGSGGFLTGVMRYVRRKILSSNSTRVAKQRQLDLHRTRLFMVEISKRLVKIAKTAMILNGDGHTGMTQGDSLDSISHLNEHVRALAGEGKPTLILTNPPFAGVGEGRVSDKKILDNFNCGLKWTIREGKYQATSELDDGVPPEMLFFERCLQWASPGGRIGIVMPKSFLDTQTYFPARQLLFRDARLLAVVNCHKNTFQPHTGVRTCLVFIQKNRLNEIPPDDYPIFMAISKKIGQDSEGIPIFKEDDSGSNLEIIDHDLDEILEDYNRFLQNNLQPSEYRFSINLSDINGDLRINPQAYLPDLNETIRKLESLDGSDNWSISTLGQICAGVRIFKGPRLKTENLIVEHDGESVEPYFTPSAVLQEKGDSAKLLDLSKASDRQLSALEAVRVYRGDILITRSGSIGRVAFITNRLNGLIVSDDLIRVRIPDEDLRLYAYAFLQSKMALDQMILNEYGSVQQHLEPHHISNIIIAIPTDSAAFSQVVERTRNTILLREKLEQSQSEMQNSVIDLFSEQFGS